MSDLDRVCAIVAKVGELESIEADQDFYKAGIDSMRAMDIMLDLETEFGVTVPDDQFVTARTPRALHALVERLQQAA